MTTLERREKCRQNRVANRHFRALRARQTRSLPLPAPLATRRPIPAGTLRRNAVQPIEGVGIGESKWKFRLDVLVGVAPQRLVESPDDRRLGDSHCPRDRRERDMPQPQCDDLLFAPGDIRASLRTLLVAAASPWKGRSVIDPCGIDLRGG